MTYEEIVKKVAKTFDHECKINVDIVNVTDLDAAQFVVADIHYTHKDESKETMRVPFVIYNEAEIFMPQDWQYGALPETADGIENISWVTYPNAHDSVMFDGLPRLFAGDF